MADRTFFDAKLKCYPYDLCPISERGLKKFNLLSDAFQRNSPTECITMKFSCQFGAVQRAEPGQNLFLAHIMLNTSK
jgi:hypothetical protein